MVAAPVANRKSLPAPSTPLIGRQDERAALAALLADPAVRLLTLVSTGGSGKTRLALEVAWDMANQFADGAVFVALAPLHDHTLVLQAIGLACGLARPGPATLAEYLRDKQLLLVLDNCEHLLAAAPDIAGLLAAAPRLQVLATSRAALNLQGEHTARVPPLRLPDLAHLPPLSALAEVPAVALLLARTRSLNPQFQLTAQNAADLAAICVRLDGLPLAIELAAARLRLLAPRDLQRRLERRLALLTTGARDLPERQQTLRATIDWSYRLLDVAEQIWFERCSVFVGGWTLANAEALEQRLRWPTATRSPDGDTTSNLLDVLGALVDKSLVQVHADNHGEPRFAMLETIREYALTCLRERGGDYDVAQMAWSFLFLGVLSYLQDAWLQAQHYFTQSLAIVSKVGNMNCLPDVFEGMAAVAAAQRRPIQAARLLGAAEALRESLALKRAPAADAYYGGILSATRAQLSEEVLYEAWEADRQPAARQAIAEAEVFARGEANGSGLQEC